VRFLFHAGSTVPIDANTLTSRPLGGTETGVIAVASNLAERGYDVTVLTSHKKPQSDKVRYLNSLNLKEEFDFFISVQSWLPLLDPFKGKKRFFWTGDAPDQLLNVGVGDPRVKVDKIFCVSEWQREALSTSSGFPIEKISVIGNGVFPERFKGVETRDRNRLIYASSPNRGLALALGLFHELWKKNQSLEFHVFSGFDIYAKEGRFTGPLASEFERLKKRAALLPNVFLRGNITQGALAREFMKSALLFYPNSFVETSCIVALEALASGCPVLATKEGGLPETVGEAGILIDPPVGTTEYNVKFLEAAEKILGDQETWERLSLKARAPSWADVTERLLSNL
jgi:glycosyltransferase involved in cell wall biosynthesis